MVDKIKVYADTFTEEELKGLISFYKSPVGQKFIEKTPELMKRSMELSQKRMQPFIQNMVKKTTQQSQKNICISNLRTLYHACEEYMIDTNTATGVTLSSTDLPLVGVAGYIPKCPYNGSALRYLNYREKASMSKCSYTRMSRS